MRKTKLFKTNDVFLKDLLSDVDRGVIQLPDFQRGWVWGDYRIRSLLASVSRGFPIGAIMTLGAGGDIRFQYRLIEGVPCAYRGVEPDEFLLDGQQRLTSLYQALASDGPVGTYDSRRRMTERWYYIDMLKAIDPTIEREDAIVSVPKGKKITRDFGRENVLDLSSPEDEYRQHMMPTKSLLSGSREWEHPYNDYWGRRDDHPCGSTAEFWNEVDNHFLDRITDYQLPVINLEKGTPKEAVCTIFEKVNTGGVSLNTFELVTATLAAENFSLRDDWADRRARMRSAYGVLQGVEGENFLQALTLLSTQERRRQAMKSGKSPEQAPPISCKKADLLNLSLNEYRQWADKVEAGFTDAAQFLHRQFVFAQRDVPYNTQLVPLAALYVELRGELKPANAQARLERWYWSGIFSEAYGGATETQFALDLIEVSEYVRNGIEPRLVTEASFTPERLVSLRTRNSAAYKGLYALQMKRGAWDWRSGTPLTLARCHDERIDIHHIFPKAWCEKRGQGISAYLYNSVINKTPISAETNRIIGGRSPSLYSTRLDKENTDLDEAFKAHWLKPELLRGDKFADCFVERGQAMFELINRAMGKLKTDGREAFRNALTSAGISEYVDDDDDVGDYDAIGEAAYESEAFAA